MGVPESLVRRQRDGIQNHSTLGALDPVHFPRLRLDGKVFVDDAEPALPRHRDGHSRLGDRVHSGGEERDLQIDLGRKG